MEDYRQPQPAGPRRHGSDMPEHVHSAGTWGTLAPLLELLDRLSEVGRSETGIPACRRR